MNNIGLFINYKADTDLERKVSEAVQIGAECCQLGFWDPMLYTDENAAKIRAALEGKSFYISALWAGWSGECEWNFTRGPVTIGLVPEKYREMRMHELLAASEFAEKIGVKQIITHVGFLPNDPNDPSYIGTIEALREIVEVMASREQYFLFETGQETPVTLLRAITDIGADNTGINLDMANLILYGMAMTADAVDVFGKYVMNTHVKDGTLPTDPYKLGKEVKAGKGRANIPLVIRKLLEIGYTGPLVVEREISGEEQKRDIIDTFSYLRSVLEEINKSK